MPPVLPDYQTSAGAHCVASAVQRTDLVLLNLILLPQLAVLVVEEDSLEDMVLERLGVVQLVLESSAVEAHFLQNQHEDEILSGTETLLTSFFGSSGNCLMRYIGWNSASPFFTLAESSRPPTVETACCLSNSTV